MTVHAMLVQLLQDVVTVVGIEFWERLVFGVFGVGADFPIEAWLEMSDQRKTVGEFTEEDVGVWVLDGLQQVV